MPTQRIPLVGQPSQRNFAAVTSYNQDQTFRGVVPVVLRNSVTGKVTVFLEKRLGLISGASVGSVTGQAVWYSPSTNKSFAAFGTTVYNSVTAVGTLSSSHFARHMSDVIMNGVTFVLITSFNSVTPTDTAGWFIPSDALAQTSYTGNRTSGSAVISSIASTAGMYSGQLITGTGIPASTRILTVDSATQITLTANASSGSGTSTVLTKEPMGKIIHASFPTSICGKFVELDGFVFIMDTNGKIWNSTINTVETWSATGFKSADTFTDGGTGLGKVGHQIIAFGTTSSEFFENRGYQSGSPLEKTGRVLPYGAMQDTVAGSYSTITDTAGVLAWYDSFSDVYMLTDGGAKKISTAPVRNFISGSGFLRAGVSSFHAWGHTVISIPFTSTTGGGVSDSMLYFVELDIWVFGNFPASVVFCQSSGSSAAGAVIPSQSTGLVYALLGDGSTYADGGSTITSVVQLGKIDFDTDKRKFVSEIDLIADEQASGTVTLEYSDDDYASWVTLGTFDLTKHQKKITRCGSHKGGRAYRLTHATAAAFRMQALDVTYTVGAS